MDSRTAHRRVGAAAVAAFLALLVPFGLHARADADPALPTAAPAATPEQSAPAEPPDGFRGRRFGRPRGGFGGGEVAPAPDSGGGGGQAAPAPDSGGGGGGQVAPDTGSSGGGNEI